jgi:2-dehydro-3-deoxygalactonokinase
MPSQFIAVDWGRRTRRIYTIAADGHVLDQRRDGQGTLATADFPAAVAALQGMAEGGPLLLAGSVASATGWMAVPHALAPAGLGALAGAIAQPQTGVFLSPGVMLDDPVRPDVMRGAEVSLLGALALGHGDRLYCVPGRHSKWVEIEDGRIARWRTIMTGGLLAALAQESALSGVLAAAGDDAEAFVAGVDHALDQPDLGADLFGAHVRVVTGRMTPNAAAARVRGLLIGADVRIGLGRSRADVVPIVGDAARCADYVVALARAGRESLVIDGDAAFAAGAHALMTRLGVFD